MAKRTNNDIQNITQKTNDWATRTTLKTQDKEHKILHKKLKIGQHEPHYKTQDKQHKILQRKLKIGQRGPHYKTQDKQHQILQLRKLKR